MTNLNFFFVRVRSNACCFESVFEENLFYFALHILFHELVLARAKEHLKRAKEDQKLVKEHLKLGREQLKLTNIQKPTLTCLNNHVWI